LSSLGTAAPVRLLVVDDDDVDRERIRRILRRSGLRIEVTEACSGQEAVEQLQSTGFDCMIVDYQLGDTTGTDLVARMGTEIDKVPVIMVTGAGDEGIAVAAMREGVSDYFSKAHLVPARLIGAIKAGMLRKRLGLELKQAQDRLAQLSLYDSLTSLENRNLFFDRLEQASLALDRGGAPFALMMMDLDRFKEVNDSLGHAAGDSLLAEIGRRLQHVARKTDSFARLGGDEFAGLLVGTNSVAGAATCAEKIVAAILEPFSVGGHLVTVGISIGVALLPLHGTNGQKVLAKADQAMYQAKRGSRGYEVFSEDDGPREPSPVLVTAYLWEALERNEFFLQFQPMINLGTGALTGVEALARWDSPRFGRISPVDFIPAAERSALIRPFTYAILDMALKQAKCWQDQGWRVPMSVNLSARMLDDEALAKNVSAALAAHGLGSDMLTLEITETALMASPARARIVLREMREAGVGISLDDFGSGFTSLKYLREFDISEIKIDGMFVKDLQVGSRDASIIRSLSALARGFNVNLVAECVEREESWPFLRELGCDVGQGYSIGHPMAAGDLLDWRRVGSHSRPGFPAQLADSR
jgi:diguanylate cyclase (GGDEF)-like protein